MLQRVVTGLVLAPLLLWAVLYGPKIAMLTVLVAAAARCADELLRMFPAIRGRDRALIALLSAAIAASPLLSWVALSLSLALAICIWLLACLVNPGDVETGARRGALGALALSYVATLIAMMVALYRIDGSAPGAPFDTGRGALMSLFVMVFMGDTGAYFAGKSMGRHKLYPLVSPKKTVEGGIGGLVASIVGGGLMSWLLVPQVPLLHGLLLGGACGFFGQVGDFAESLFKRATGTKDSGQLLPGHGGLLDRVDGVLFAAPVLLTYFVLAAPYVP